LLMITLPGSNASMNCEASAPTTLLWHQILFDRTKKRML
jgi:hypothetical protein